MQIIQAPFWLDTNKFKYGEDIIKYFKKCIKSNPNRYYIRQCGIIIQLIDKEYENQWIDYSDLILKNKILN